MYEQYSCNEKQKNCEKLRSPRKARLPSSLPVSHDVAVGFRTSFPTGHRGHYVAVKDITSDVTFLVLAYDIALHGLPVSYGGVLFLFRFWFPPPS